MEVSRLSPRRLWIYHFAGNVLVRIGVHRASATTQRRDLEFGSDVVALMLLAQALTTEARSSVCSTDNIVEKLDDDDWERVYNGIKKCAKVMAKQSSFRQLRVAWTRLALLSHRGNVQLYSRWST